jgi:hypothetical protein
MGHMRWCCAGLVLFSLFYPVSRTYAQADQTAETAQDWFQHGVALSRAAQWSEARAAYLRSLELEPRVSTYFNLATASLKLRLGRATLLALDDFAPLADPRVHAEFLAEAARMRADALDLTGTLVLSGLHVAATVQIDQEARDWLLAPHQEHSISLDPGHHVLTLRAPSHLPSSLEVDIVRGASARLSTTLSPVRRAATPAQPAQPAQPENKSTAKVLIWSGVAAVGLGVLATVLVLTLRGPSPAPFGGSVNMVFD